MQCTQRTDLNIFIGKSIHENFIATPALIISFNRFPIGYIHFISLNISSSEERYSKRYIPMVKVKREHVHKGSISSSPRRLRLLDAFNMLESVSYE